MKQMLVVMMLVLLSGCSVIGGDGTPYQKTYKALSVSKQTAVLLATTAKDLHYNGVIDDVKIAKVKDAYERAKKAQEMLINAQIFAIDVSDLDSQQRAQVLTTVFMRSMTEFVNLAIEIGLIEQGDDRIVIGVRPRPDQRTTTQSIEK